MAKQVLLHRRSSPYSRCSHLTAANKAQRKQRVGAITSKIILKVRELLMLHDVNVSLSILSESQIALTTDPLSLAYAFEPEVYVLRESEIALIDLVNLSKDWPHAITLIIDFVAVV